MKQYETTKADENDGCVTGSVASEESVGTGWLHVINFATLVLSKGSFKLLHNRTTEFWRAGSPERVRLESTSDFGMQTAWVHIKYHGTDACVPSTQQLKRALCMWLHLYRIARYLA